MSIYNSGKTPEENYRDIRAFMKNHPWFTFSVLCCILVSWTYSAYRGHQGTQISDLKETLEAKDTEIQGKNIEIQRLETLLTPFRQIALERYTGTEDERLAALAVRVKEVEATVDLLKDYAYAAQFSAIGEKMVGSGVHLGGGLAAILKSCVKKTKNLTQYGCGPDCERTYREVIDKFPNFPFAYYYLAFCLKQRGDSTWKAYGQKSVDILEKTTQVAGHYFEHDEFLPDARKLMEDSTQ